MSSSNGRTDRAEWLRAALERFREDQGPRRGALVVSITDITTGKKVEWTLPLPRAVDLAALSPSDRRIVEALGGETLLAKQIARRLGRKLNSNLRGQLRGLCDSTPPVLTHTPRGYRRADLEDS